jgi:hypothetical protein
MKYSICFALFFWVLGLGSYAQNIRIKGIILDSSTNTYLQNASVVLLNKNDSLIISDTRTDSVGQFYFREIPINQNCILFISYPGFVSYSVTPDFAKAINGDLILNEIKLLSKGSLLQEVVVKARLNNIRVRGDTIEYNADKIKLPPNATVEDLLKILPGLQIDSKGQITAQGKKIKQVLVDGEEFFSDDPTLVTKNLRSDMISRIQVYDKKSELSNFTGIEDGIQDRVINLKLKEDKSNGLFGKVEVGVGTGIQHNKVYTVQAFLNWFKGKRKASAFFSGNNVGQWGLSNTDNNKLGLIGNVEQYDGRGIPTSSFGGLHYDNKWNNDRSSLNGDYNFSSISITGNDFTVSQNNLLTDIIRRNSSNATYIKENANKGILSLKHTIDTTSDLSFLTAGSFGNRIDKRNYTATDRDGRERLLNEIETQEDASINFQSFVMNALWQKKFRKPGRTISISWDNLVKKTDGKNAFLSLTDYYNGNSVIDSSVILNLIKQTDNLERRLDANINFSEKLSKNLSILLGYKVSQNYSDDNNFSIPSLTFPIIKFDSTFSTDRINNNWQHIGNFNLNLALRNSRISAGSVGGFSNISIQDEIKGKQFSRSYNIWKPFLSFNYKFKEQTNFEINYRGTTIIPEFQQLFPYNFNNTQLINYLDNAEINNSFSNNISASFESFKNISNIFTAITASYTNVSNPITLGMNIDESGAYSLMYLNLYGFQNNIFSLAGFYSRPLSRKNLQLTFDLNINGGRTYNFVNESVNKLNYEIYSVGIFGSKNKANSYEINLGTTINYNSNSLIGVQKVNNNFLSFTLKPSLKIFVFKRIQINSDAEYVWQEKTEVFQNNFDRFIWNAGISGSVLKSEQLVFKISGIDLLNANIGFSRKATSNFFTESRFLTMRRYFMITASWNFSKFKKIKS